MPLGNERSGDLESFQALLAAYFTVATDIAALLDEGGRPNRSRYAEYERLCDRRERLEAALVDASPDYETTDFDAILDAALPSQ